MRTKEQVRMYKALYDRNKMWTCSVCGEEMKITRKYNHLRKDYHLINVENMIANGLEVPNFKKSAPKDWKCYICDDGYIYKNKSQHCLSDTHKRNQALLIQKGLPITSMKVYETFIPNFSKLVDVC